MTAINASVKILSQDRKDMYIVYTKDMYIAILGRLPALGIAELENLHGSSAVSWHSDLSALVERDTFSIDHIGGTQKAGKVIARHKATTWLQSSEKIIQHYTKAWAQFDGKLTIGISAYGFKTAARDVQKTGIILKQRLKKSGVNIRLIPNNEPALSSATSHHNKLGLSPNKIELIVVRNRDGNVVIAESIGAQNITALARRDQGRPKRDAFVGMLPPKLAQIMINLAYPHSTTGRPARILDPFCGTGVVLQEAALMGFDVYGTDLADKMVEYSRANFDWLASSHHLSANATIHQGDAMDTLWKQPIDSVVCEGYLGQPFSAPPSPAKLEQVRGNCNHILGTFLKNIAPQLQPGTPLCIAVPAWRNKDGRLSHLPLARDIEGFGFIRHTFANCAPSDLIYYREDQVVARELLVLEKK